MNYLTVSEITTINDTIRDMSHYNPKIEYVDVFDTRTDKLDALICIAPFNSNLLDAATYYMKNIIIMQCFSDSNHRTAIEAVRLFFHKNNVNFKWNPKEIVKIQRDIYKLRYKIYNTYEELSISVLTEPHNSLLYYCRNRIEDILSDNFIAEAQESRYPHRASFR